MTTESLSSQVSRPVTFPAPASAELRLILRLIRVALGVGRASSEPEMGPVNWPVFLHLIARHRVAAFLWHRAQEDIRALCPIDVQESLRASSMGNLQRALIQAAEQIKIVRSLEEKGIGVMAFKGLCSARQFYGGIGQRHVGDIDLLVRVEDMDRADAVLRGSGLKRIKPDFQLTPRQARQYLKYSREYEYFRTTSGVRIELGSWLEGVPETEDLWKQKVVCIVGGASIAMPNENYLIPSLFQHGARHGWFRLFWLVDIALIFQRASVDWTAMMDRARNLGIERPILQGAMLVETLFGVTSRAEVRPKKDEEKMTIALSREAGRQIGRDLPELESAGEHLTQLIYRARLQKRLQEKFSVFGPHIYHERVWKILQLPDFLFPLYFIGTPCFWAWRAVKRIIPSSMERDRPAVRLRT